MGFITTADFDDIIKSEILDAVIDGSTTAFDDAHDSAQGICESFISNRYNTDSIFAKTGADRDPVVMTIMKDILLYRLYCRINPRAVPEIRKLNEETAMKMLMNIQKGSMQLPRSLSLVDSTVDPPEDESGRRFGSSQSTPHQFTW